MSGQSRKKSAEIIKDIANGAKGLRFPIMSGTVVAGSVDATKQVCSVLLGVSDSSAPTTGIMLNSVSMNNNGLIVYPADGSNVLVGEVDGPGKWAIIKCSDLVKLLVTIGATTYTITNRKIQFNDGSLGGLVVVGDIVTRLNNIENDQNMLKNIFTTWVPVADDGGAALKTAATAWAADELTVTVAADIENTKITQG